MICSRIDELYLLTGLLKFMLRVMGIGITASNPQSEFVLDIVSNVEGMLICCHPKPGTS